MTRTLRQRHRHTVIALGCLLPIAFALGMVVRKTIPSMDRFPANLAAMPLKSGATEWERADLFVKSPIKVRLLREPGKSGRGAVEFSAPAKFVKPDLLVYWVHEGAPLTDRLPNDAQLLGTFDASSALALPADSTTQNGKLVLYSLADAEVVEMSKTFSSQKP